MKKIAVTLFLSFLIGIANSAKPPVISVESSYAPLSAFHSHCDESINTLNHEKSATPEKFSHAHYCCSAVAVFGEPISIELLGLSSFYLLGEISRPASNIAESIYKPPKHYL